MNPDKLNLKHLRRKVRNLTHDRTYQGLEIGRLRKRIAELEDEVARAVKTHNEYVRHPNRL